MRSFIASFLAFSTSARVGAGVIAWLLACVAACAQTFSFVSAFAEDVGRPTGIALDTIGGVSWLYVSDHGAGRVFKYNLATGVRTQIGNPGTGDGQFLAPDAIGIDPATHDLYIADRQLHRITRLTNTGAFVVKWGGTGPETNRFGHPGAGRAPGQFNGPQGVVVDAAGLIYVTEHENHRVQKFRVTSAGGNWNVETLTTWGSGGGAPGQFNTPYGIALDAAGNVWVADGFNSRLQRFTPNGELLSQLVVRGTSEPHLVVTWVAFDPAGDLYVAITSDPNTGGDIANQRIEKFSAAGVSLAKWGSYGAAPGQFKLPFGIALHTATNRAYVADWDNGRVQVFDLGAPATPQPSGPAGRLINLSSRLRVNSGDSSRTVVAGFVVAGNAPKPVLVRAVGPGLGAFGVSEPLANPRLVLRDNAGRTVGENDDWEAAGPASATGNRVGAFALASGSRDAALVATLAPGAYTAEVTGSGASGGIVLLEAYDAGTDTTPAAPKLVNISTRGFVDTGEGQLAAGFVVSPGGSKRVLIRAIGPGLTSFGVAGVVADPVLRVFAAGNGTPLVQNDNWETAQSAGAATAAEIRAASTAAGAFALATGSRDAAVIVTLSPGNYSAMVSGANNGTGAGLVEVYELAGP